ncbi:MAG: hypothetical protein L3J79_00460 [Candidatus Marinimicrobia bacterium]|nr:hypothetical protein [Candidatus Neomarinimicrobiota bacterium]
MMLLCLFLVPGILAQSMNIKWIKFQLDKWKAELNSETESRLRELSGVRYTGESQRNDFQEEFSLAGQGSIYHPNLLVFFIDATMGFQQGTYDISNSSYPGTRNAGLLRNFNFQTRILPQKPVSFSTSIYRNSQLKEDSFFDNNKTSLARETIQINWSNLVFPLAFNYSQNAQKEFLGVREIQESRNQANLNGNFGKRDLLNGNFRITKTIKTREEKVLGRQTYNNFNLQTYLSYPLEKASKNRITNSVGFNRIYSKDSTALIKINTKFSYRLTPTLNSRSSFVNTTRIYNRNYSRSYQLMTNFEHILFSSLQSSLSVEALRFTDQAYQKQYLEYSASTSYQKSLKQGTIFIDLSLTPKWEQVESESGPLRNGQANLQLLGFSPTWLRQSSILAESIKVFDQLNEIQYEEQFDYALLITDSFLQIQRVPGSAIPDSALVQVFYTFAGEASYAADRKVYGYGIRYSFQDYWGIEIGYNAQTTKYPGYSAIGRQSIDPFHTHKWFLILDYQPFNVNLDYEMSTSTITPYNLTSCSIDGLSGSFANQYLLGRAQISRQNLLAQMDQVDQKQLHLEYFRRLSRNIRIQLMWGYRDVSGNLNDLRESKWHLTLQYTQRKLKAKLILTQLTTNLYDDSDTSRKGVLQFSINS